MDYSIQSRRPWLIRVLTNCIEQGATLEDIAEATALLGERGRGVLPPVGAVACVNLEEVQLHPEDDIGEFFCARHKALEDAGIFLSDDDYLEMG